MNDPWVDSLNPYELMTSLRMRESSAIGRIYDAYGRRAYSVAYRILNDHGMAEEAVQDAFMDLWRNAERLDPSRGKIDSLLLVVVRYKALDKLRKRRGQAAHFDGIDIDLLQDTHGGGFDSIAAVLDKSMVKTALQALPEEQVRVIELAYYGGYTHVEISQMLSLPLGTVKSRMRLALDRLRGLLRQEEVGDLSRGG